MNTRSNFDFTIDSSDCYSQTIKFSGLICSLEELYMVLDEINSGTDTTLPDRNMGAFFVKNKIIEGTTSKKVGSVKGNNFDEFFHIVKDAYDNRNNIDAENQQTNDTIKN